jgi:hypothetical protein
MSTACRKRLDATRDPRSHLAPVRDHVAQKSSIVHEVHRAFA